MTRPKPGVIDSELSEVGVIRSCVLPLSSLGPLRALFRRVSPSVERVVCRISADALASRRSDPRGVSHLDRPLNPHRAQSAFGQVEERKSLPPKRLDPVDFCLAEFVEIFYAIEKVNVNGFALVCPKPIVKRRLSTGTSNLQMFSQASFRRLRCETYVAIDEVRPEPNPIDHTSGRKLSSHAATIGLTSDMYG